ncbi:MAG: methylmalonyl-CoA mutase family protein, partial [Alphaproteobacteria bacterium]|nr:methylmalonyl-CoA mutase family protein [Alphaproteobacteria bacterium]
ADDPYNNVVRTSFEAMAAVLGGTQSLHTNAFDEALALPSESSARLARNTQLILQHETGIADVVDPMAGSYYVERLTEDLAVAAEKLIGEIDEMGGMTNAVKAGWPKLQIEEAATRRQARIDKGEDVMVGVNRYRSSDEAAEILAVDILAVDNAAVRADQIVRLNAVRGDRDGTCVDMALAELTRAARDDGGNLLALSIEAMAARATVGEVSAALEAVFTRYEAKTKTVKGIYAAEHEDDPAFQAVREDVDRFATDEGRRPKLLVAKLGQDGHDRGAKIIASAFTDLGFDVALGPLFASPAEVARRAIELGANAVGVSTLAGAHRTLVPELSRALQEQGGGDVLIVCGGVIPARDHGFLKENGVAALYGPGTNICAASKEVLALIRASLHRNV